jgi:hypothetical protein
MAGRNKFLRHSSLSFGKVGFCSPGRGRTGSLNSPASPEPARLPCRRRGQATQFSCACLLRSVSWFAVGYVRTPKRTHRLQLGSERRISYTINAGRLSNAKCNRLGGRPFARCRL